MSLADEHVISSYNIQRDSTVHLVIKVNPDKPNGEKRKVHSAVHSVRDVEHQHPRIHPVTAFQSPLPVPNPVDRYRSQFNQQRSSPERMTTSLDNYRTMPFSHSYSSPTDDQITLTIVTYSGRQLQVHISSKDSVSGLKQIITARENIHTQQHLIRLVYAGREIQDGQLLSYYGITSNCTIHLQLSAKPNMTLFVKTLTGKTYVVYPSENDTISEVKQQLQEKSNIPAACQRLVFEGKNLDENSKLKNCNLPSQCTIHVIQTNPPVVTQPSLPILVRTFTGKTITILVGPGDNVTDVKHKIQQEEGYPIDKITLMFGGKELEDGAPLNHYQIQQDSTLLVSFKPNTAIGISVINTLTNETLRIDGLNTNDCVSDIQETLFTRLNLPTHIQSIVYNGRITNPRLTLEQSDIVDGSVIYLHTTQPTKVTFNINTVAKVTCQVCMSPFQPTLALKQKIQDILGPPASEQVLLYDGNVLDDESMLCDYSIADESTIHLFSKRGSTKHVVVKLPNGMSKPLNIPTDVTVARLKIILQQDEGVIPSLQIITYRGLQLEPQYTLGDYAISDGAVLSLSVLSQSPWTFFIETNKNSKSFSFSANPTDSVGVLKLKIANYLSVPVSSLLLSFSGTHLLDQCLVVECNLPNPCVLYAEFVHIP